MAIETIYRIDLDPDETDELERIVQKARESHSYLHVELRKVTDERNRSQHPPR